MSTNTSVACLNTILIQNLEFTKKPLYNIRTDGTLPVWLWAAEEPPKQTGGPTAQHCILLANTQNTQKDGLSKTLKDSHHLANNKKLGNITKTIYIYTQAIRFTHSF